MKHQLLEELCHHGMTLEDRLRVTEIILYCCRTNVERRASSLDQLGRTLSFFRPSTPVSLDIVAAEPDIEKIREHANDLRAGIEALFELHSITAETLSKILAGRNERLPDQWARAILESQLAPLIEGMGYLAKSASTDRQSSYSIAGTRFAIVNSLLAVLSTLQKGDSLIALTTPTIWKPQNFGPTGRISTQILMLMLRGVRVKWLNIVRLDDFYKQEAREILACRMSDNNLFVNESGLSEEAAASLKVECIKEHLGYSYLVLPADEYEAIIRERMLFLSVEFGSLSAPDQTAKGRSNNQKLLIAPDFLNRGGAMARMTYWPEPDRLPKLENTFDILLNKSSWSDYSGGR